MRPKIIKAFGLLSVLAFLAGCASGPNYVNHANRSAVGGPADVQAQTRGYAHSTPDYPGFDYRDILSDPGHF